MQSTSSKVRRRMPPWSLPTVSSSRAMEVSCSCACLWAMSAVVASGVSVKPSDGRLASGQGAVEGMDPNVDAVCAGKACSTDGFAVEDKRACSVANGASSEASDCKGEALGVVANSWRFFGTDLSSSLGACEPRLAGRSWSKVCHACLGLTLSNLP